MNSLTWTFLIGCTVLLFTAERVEGLRCYECIGTGCEDEFNADGIQIEERCNGSCTKLKLGKLVTRACGIANLGDDCHEQGEAVLCYCDSNLCNGSTAAVASTLVMGAFVAVYLMLKKIRD